MRKILQSIVVPLLLFFSVPLMVSAQEKNITGTVLSDDDGTPMVGVTVTNTTTNKRVQTNSAGYYAIEGQKGEKLTFTFVGYALQTATIVDNRLVIFVLFQAIKTSAT